MEEINLCGKYEAFSEYKVSSDGYVIGKKGKPLSTSKKCTGGYVQIGLYDRDYKRKYFRIHRLMAYVFLKKEMLDEEFDLLVVNHKDGNKENNRLNNLELIIEEENRIHATNTGLTHGKKTSNTKLYCYNNKTIYPSKKEACRQLNVNERSLSSHLASKRTHVGGYIFIECIDDSLETLYEKGKLLYDIFLQSKPRVMPKECIDTNNNIIYLNFTEAEKGTGIGRKAISKMCNSLNENERFRFR